MLDDNAKSAIDCDSKIWKYVAALFPYLMFVPKWLIQSGHVQEYRQNARDRCIFQAIGSILFALTISVLVNSRYSAIGWGNFGISLIYAVAILTIPLSLFAKLFDVYGVKQNCLFVHVEEFTRLTKLGWRKLVKSFQFRGSIWKRLSLLRTFWQSNTCTSGFALSCQSPFLFAVLNIRNIAVS